MPTTYLQTVVTEIGNKRSYSLENAPVCAYTIGPTREFVAVKVSDSSIVTWWKNGEIIKILSNGTYKTWYPKPCMNDVVCAKPMRGYFQFHKDDSVTSTLYGEPFYWSAPVSQPAEAGVEVFYRE